GSSAVRAAEDPLPSWTEGTTKAAIIAFVHDTTDPGSPKFVPPQARIAAFDQDGTLWVEHPMYTQVLYCLDRVRVLAPKHPAWKTSEPFKTVLSGDQAAMAKLTMRDLEVILAATLSGMSVDNFEDDVSRWMASARDGRWHRPYSDLTYQPMKEVLSYLRASGYKTYIVTGGGQDSARV